jgi:hypothetical protein
VSILLLSVAVNALLVGLVYLLARRRINHLLSGGEALNAIQDEINRLVVELNQTSDRNIGIIEERLNRLRKLVDEADRKIMLLGKESEKVRLGTDVYDKLKKSKSLVSEDQTRETSPKANPKATGDFVPAGADDAVPAAAIPAPSAAAKAAPITATSETEQQKPATPGDEVIALHRQGFDPKIIAAKTGSPLGEIELIISLSGGSR